MAVIFTVASASLRCASAAPGRAADRAAVTTAAPAAAATASRGASRFVHLRGPEELDCAAELERARGSGDSSALFLAEFKCRVFPAWTCRASCKGDELLVTHVALGIGADGGLLEARVVRPSDRGDFDEMTVAALKTTAPFAAPPPPLLDRAGAVAFNVEFACDCARRSPRP